MSINAHDAVRYLKKVHDRRIAVYTSPILLGLKKSVHILQLGSSVREIVNMVTIAVVDAQAKEQANG